MDPPKAMTTAMAFSNASFVMMSRAVMPWRSRLTTASPERRAKPSRRRSVAGGAAEPGSDMPMASAAEAIVLAVYMPPQAPLARADRPLDGVDVLPAHPAGGAGTDGLEGVDDGHRPLEPSEALAIPGRIVPA